MDIRRIVVCLLSVVMLVTMLLPAGALPVMAAGLQEQHQQYQNGADTKTPEWANGDINKSNSNYAEGDSVPYRYEFKDVPANACLRFEIHYDFTKGGKYAFDFLTSVKRTETTIDLFSSPQSPLTSLTEATCNCTAVAIPDDPDIDTDDLVISDEGTQYFTICGDYVSASVESGPTLKALAKDGDNEKVITLVIKASDAASNQIAVAWGGHLAIGDEANWGVGNGASSISGAPFHMRGEGFSDDNCNEEKDQGEATLGSGDRSIQSNAIAGRIYARIRIDPPDDTNLVGDLHEFTATVETSTDGVTWDPYEGATVTFEVTSGPGTLDPLTDVTDSDGEAETTLSSNVTGTTTVKASTTVYGFDISTDGTGGSSDPAEKDWVYARIRIAPLEDTNLLGDPHEFTATVEISTDGIAWDPYEGATVTFEVTDGPGTLDPLTDVTDADGEAKTVLTSDEVGVTTVTASTTVYGFDLATDGTAYNSDAAEKDWVGARIRITPPEDTNVVGDPHEFTAIVETYNGTDWLPFAGATVTFEVIDGPGTLDPLTDVTGTDGKAKTTLSSNVTGTTTVNASTTVYGFDLATDGTANNSEPAQKDWVYARITITPPEDTNVAGDPHEFTATVETSTDGISWDPYEGATVTFNVTDGPGTLDPVSDVTDSDGEAKTTLYSNVTGTTTVEASTTVYGFDLATDGTANNSEPAQKDWVYARIRITPPEDTNRIGDPHEFTATVETSANGVTWDPYEGATVTFNVTSGPGTLDPAANVTDVNGEVKTILTSDEIGTSIVTASTTVYGFDLTTDGTANNSEPAQKDWVYARIRITPPNDTNRVGDPHEFTATVETYNGTDWLPFAGATVTFNVTSGPGTLEPATNVTDVNGEAKTILTSDEIGTSIVTASTTVDGFDISTNGIGGSSEPARKDWVYARIRITPPQDTNVVGDPHEFTVTVETFNGTDWLPFAGANVTFEVIDGPGTLDPLTDVTDGNGEAKTTLTSNAVGTSIVAASTTVDGFDICTDGTSSSSDPAQKDWVYARIRITPPQDTNVVGDPHEFTATVETFNGTDWLPFAGANVTFNVTSGPGTLDPLIDITDADGEAKTTLSSNSIGTTNVTASTTVYGFDLSTDGEANNSEPAQKDWVYARIRITPPEDTNVVGDPHEFTAIVETSTDGTTWLPFVGANVTFNVTSGPGTLDPLIDITDADGEAKTTLSSNSTGTTAVRASTTVYGFDLSTDGTGNNSEPAHKHWVDARISIGESGVNPVGQPHDFTVTVEKYVGEGWVPAVGVNVTGTTNFGTLTGSPAITNHSGRVIFTVNSSEAGTATVHASAEVSVSDLNITVATDGYGAYAVDNTKTWITPPTPAGGGGGGCPRTRYLTVDWEGCNTSKPLYSNDKLVMNLTGPSPDLSHSLFLERGTHAPVVDERTYYLIVVRELEQIPATPENTVALVVFNVTPADAEFDRDILLTLGLNQTQLPANTLNVTMAYYDDVNGVWETLEYEAGGPNGVAELTLSAPINHFSIYGVLAELGPAPQPAHFVAGGLTIVPSVEKISAFVTKTGEVVTISANVANDGEQEGTFDVVLKLNGQTVDTNTVTIGAGQSKLVIFTRSGLDYGEYDVEVAGLSGDFTVSQTLTWWLIILLIVAIGLIIWGVVWGRKKRRKAQQET